MHLLFYFLLILTSCQHFNRAGESQTPQRNDYDEKNSIIQAFLDGDFHLVEHTEITQGNLESLQNLIKAEVFFMLEQYDEALTFYERSNELIPNTYSKSMAELCVQMEEVSAMKTSLFDALSTLEGKESFTYPDGYQLFLNSVKEKWIVPTKEIELKNISSVISLQMVQGKKIDTSIGKNHFIYNWVQDYTEPSDPTKVLDERNRLVGILQVIKGTASPVNVVQKEYFDDFEDEQFRIGFNYLFNEYGPVLNSPKPLSINWSSILENLPKLGNSLKSMLASDLYSQLYSTEEKDKILRKLIEDNSWPSQTKRTHFQWVPKSQVLQELDRSKKLEDLLKDSVNLTIKYAARTERTIAKSNGIYRPSFLGKYFNEL